MTVIQDDLNFSTMILEFLTWWKQIMEHILRTLTVSITYESASIPLVGFGELNHNTIKGLTSLLSVEQEIEYIANTWILQTKMYQKFNKKASLMVFHIVLKWRPKLCIVVLEDHENNLVQAKDNNANVINEMAYMLRDIITSCESKHIWQIKNETWVDDFGLVSIVACFTWTRRDC
jgi:hypothetical protein